MLKLVDAKLADPAIATMWLKNVLQGDFRFFKEYLDRTEGKVPDKVESSGGMTIVVQYVESQRGEDIPTETSPESAEDSATDEAVQCGELRETMGQDSAGSEPLDSASS